MSNTTTTSHSVTIAPKAATATSLAGFQITCTCGYVQGCSSHFLTQEWAREHLEFHAGRGIFAGRARRAKV